jgi:hypothetical protein
MDEELEPAVAELKEAMEPKMGAKSGTMLKVVAGFEFDGVIREMGLGGIVVSVNDELKLWAANKMFPAGTRVHVKLETV